ncbi:MAG: DUF2071 domain-containing protein, partial [Candidatus Saccharimonadales bacterium]
MLDSPASVNPPRKSAPPAATTGRALRVRALHMCWENLAFFHWPLEAARVQPLLPPRLKLDTFE